jgi:ABC-2 type transport system permease protein
MRNIWHIAVQTQFKLLRNPSFAIMMLLMPMIFIFILGTALSTEFKQDDHTVQNVRLVLLDNGNSIDLKNRILDYVDTLSTEALIQIEKVDSLQNLEDQLTEKEADMGLIATAAVPWTIVLGKEEGKNLTGQTILTNFYGQLNHSQIEQPIHVPIVEMIKLNKNEKRYTAMQYYATTNIIMFILYAGMSSSISLIREREQNTLMRLNSLPIENRHIIYGILFGNAILACSSTLMIIVGTALIYGVQWGEQYIALALIFSIFILISLVLGSLVALILKTTKAATAFFQTLVIAMTFISGGFAANLDQLRLFAVLEKFTLNYWAVQSLLHSMLNNDFQEIYYPICVLAIIGASLIALLGLVYRKVGYYE